ncbi:MAG: 4Fe-4S dicluster domain-containing protein [Proteobacteria bacterium]|nr:4Fe-4S dicluster domain-containing protein [Pseudomonadota bacterium]MBU4470570.1 4Fe-4S dicluster domain-containing protein [Pseudomonadota bacterium]MCG2751406.1 4Fe-4S dicluster domain-containing protein [Desulfobacteraceae bacterium]
MMTQYGLHIDQNRCTGCFACVVACKDWHNVPAGPASWINVKVIEKGTYPDLFVAFLPTTCYHCKSPACVDACPVGAIAKRDEDGIVTVDRELCLGKTDCGQCLEACSYGAPQFGEEEDAKMQKCDLCIDRWAESKKPVCVMSCPMYALDAGPLEDLRKKEQIARETEGFTYSESLGPSVLFKAKRNSCGS